MNKSYKTELNPTGQQVEWFRLCCLARRLTYNWLLGHYDDSYETVDPQVDAALVALHAAPGDPAVIGTLLRLTTLGLGESPIRQHRRDNKIKGMWPANPNMKVGAWEKDEKFEVYRCAVLYPDRRDVMVLEYQPGMRLTGLRGGMTWAARLRLHD